MGRKAESFRRNVNIALVVGTFVVLGGSLALSFTALRKKVHRRRHDPQAVLKFLATAQRKSALQKADGREAPAPSLKALAAAGLIPDEYLGEVFGYRYRFEVDGETWVLRAEPTTADPPVHYLRNQFDSVWCAEGRPATPKDRLVSSPRARRGY